MTIGENATESTSYAKVQPKAPYIEKLVVKYNSNNTTSAGVSLDFSKFALDETPSTGTTWAKGVKPADFDASKVTFYVNGGTSFTVPKYATGTYPVTITIAGYTASQDLELSIQ